MSDFKAIRLLKSLLKQRDMWFLDVLTPKGFESLGQKAKGYADKRLSQLSLLFLWQRYKKWRESEPIMRNSDDYFHAFLADIAFSLASDHLNSEIFDKNCSFTFKFIRL
jgi:hypothetical protein